MSELNAAIQNLVAQLKREIQERMQILHRLQDLSLPDTDTVIKQGVNKSMPKGDKSKAVVDYVKANPNGVTASDVTAHMKEKFGEADIRNVRQMVAMLVNSGKIIRKARGVFGPTHDD